MEREIEDAVAPGDAEFLDATKLATGLMGDSIATNLFMVGYAYQRGLLPVGEAAILRAIELNGAAVESNKQSFHWGRLAAVDPAHGVGRWRFRRPSPSRSACRASLDEMIARRAEFLTDYQDAAYAKRYTDLVARVRAAEAREGAGRDARSTEAVARYYFKLLAFKDEYEVARLYAETDFAQRVAAQFEGDYKLDVPPRAAARSASPTRRPASRRRSDLRPVDDERVPRAREAAPLPRHRARHLRPHGGAQAGARADRRVRGADRRDRSPRSRRTITRSPSSSRRFPSTSAATATSRSASSARRRRRKRGCSPRSARPRPHRRPLRR